MTRLASDAPPARLVLDDGTCFRGTAFGGWATNPVRTGEVVFNTALTGYQESLSDPSYAGQILTMTATEVGVYGVTDADLESTGPQVAGFVIRERSRHPSNHRATAKLEAWLEEAGVPGIEGIDTRALVRRLRVRGACRGVIGCDPSMTDGELLALARSAPEMSGRNLAAEVGAATPVTWEEDLGEWSFGGPYPALSRPRTVIALDCGAKRNILRHLSERGLTVEVVPHSISAAAILARKPDGLFISNGPGDPAAVENTIALLREVAGTVPTFGICLGHQLLALALGAKTFKLKFGHRGANQPVRDMLTGAVEITSQNHGFCVDESSLTDLDLEVTHRHLNDDTVAGFRHRTKPIFAVQYHPEASPGPHDAAHLFDAFVWMIENGTALDAKAMRTVRAARFGAGSGLVGANP